MNFGSMIEPLKQVARIHVGCVRQRKSVWWRHGHILSHSPAAFSWRRSSDKHEGNPFDGGGLAWLLDAQTLRLPEDSLFH